VRINRYLANALGISRRKADYVIEHNKVLINGDVASLGANVTEADEVTLNGKKIALPNIAATTVMFNKPPGYVCSRDGQGSKTIYDLLPDEYKNLYSVGRLDKDSSGLLILTNDGELANKLTHPSFQKQKVYQVSLDKTLSEADKTSIQQGVELDDGISRLRLSGFGKEWQVTMVEGRNRQIRRTFEKLNYRITKLHRTQFGKYALDELTSGSSIKIQ